ncbi:Mitochondrial FAD carrier protein FLX1 [Madurella mycetomatis]|uniref:Mitochondrial FAD carrier protein FLX1 n=1 Tax=Madurella mycetomatis TaxID=100816 RepID=A0A175W1Z8_9PEZI|nr:Mitochondrial FAD carrier protein FLX1 [Madurella mycetomatis]
MTETKDAGPSRAVVETVAGLSAGSMATLIVHPLDIVKTRMQSNYAVPALAPKRLVQCRLLISRPLVHRSSVAPATSLTTVSLIRSLAATDRPLAALYRGLTPNLLGNATSWASFFFFKSRLERGIAHLRGDDADSTLQPLSGPQRRLSPADFFVASLAAGALTQVITNPIWVLKTRMLSSDRSAAGAYPSMWSGAVRLLREEGVWGFYRGLGVGMLAVSHGAVQFAVYDPARRMYLSRRRRRWEETHPSPEHPGGDPGGSGDAERGNQVSNEATVVLSTVSKLVAGAVTYPLQVLRSRLQQYDAEAQFGKGVTGVVRKLWHEEGFRGFYRGVMPGVVRVLPATWVTFLVYENVKYYLPRWARGTGEEDHVAA